MEGKNNVVTTVIIVVLLAATAYFGFKYYKASRDPQVVAQAEVEKLVAEVGRLMVLPADETPTVATVSDPEALLEQPFFDGAEKGDKVLIYTTARKAILYSTSLRKILQVAPINIGNNVGTQTPTPTPAAPESTSEE